VNGLLVLIESGNPLGSHTVRSGRQFILDCINRYCQTDLLSVFVSKYFA
jgi:ribosomal protein RSM22 (predicted rRNA methylase)